MEISNLKSAATLLTRYYAIQKLQGLSNEIVRIRVRGCKTTEGQTWRSEKILTV